MEIRNIALSPTLTTANNPDRCLMKQTGVAEEGFTMDTNELEKERGITIYSKNASVFYKDTRLISWTLPDTLISVRKWSEVLRSIDSVLLVLMPRKDRAAD
jgi:GTP-binding protein